MDSQLLTLLVRIDNLKEQRRLTSIVDQLFQDIIKYIQNQSILQDKQIELLNNSHSKVVQELRDFCNNLKADNDSYIKEQVSTQVNQIVASNSNKLNDIKDMIQQELDHFKSVNPLNYAQDFLLISSFLRSLLLKLR